MTLPEMLVHVAEFAVRAIPGADGAGLTLLVDGRADTIVSSADFVRAVVDVQYGLGEGPCIDAAATGRTVRSGSLGGDSAYPRFGSRVSLLGVHSALSLPLLGPDGPVGAMNVYAQLARATTPKLTHGRGALIAPTSALNQLELTNDQIRLHQAALRDLIDPTPTCTSNFYRQPGGSRRLVWITGGGVL